MINSSLVLYVHGKNGNAEECENYKRLFPDYDVLGMDYKTFTPWETGREIHTAVKEFASKYKNIILIANSIGAFFAMCADINDFVKSSYFISPIVDMEKLILDMMILDNLKESELKTKKIILTSFGEELSWDYLCYVRANPIKWTVPTKILYGRNDNMTSYETIEMFAKKHGASLTIMENGEHWFHTSEQMQFLYEWLSKDMS